MIIVFGSSSQIQPLGMEPGVCPACGAEGYRQIERQYRVAHAFFCPLFVTSEQVVADCGRCGHSQRIAPPAGAPKAPRLYRFGFLVPVAGFAVLVLLAAIGTVRKANARSAREAAEVELASRIEQRLEGRLKRYQDEVQLGVTRGIGAEAQRAADELAPVLRGRMGVKDAELGLLVVMVQAPSGKRVLLLTRVEDGVDVPRLDLDAIAESVGEVMYARCARGSLVTWSVLQGGRYVASIGGRLGGDRFSLHTADPARKAAAETLDFEGFARGF